jgi:hypothetical protein
VVDEMATTVSDGRIPVCLPVLLRVEVFLWPGRRKTVIGSWRLNPYLIDRFMFSAVQDFEPIVAKLIEV